MKYLYTLIFSTLLSFLHPSDEEQRLIRRVQSHFILKDYEGALKAAQYYLHRHPHSKNLKQIHIEALISRGYEKKALKEWKKWTSKYPEEKHNTTTLNALSWGVLRKGVSSTQYVTKLTSLIGAFLTRDVKAVPIIQEMLQDPNAVIRTVAVQLACQYRDDPLKDEITRLIKEERIWLVRLELIKSIGKMGMKNHSEFLASCLENDRSTMEEKAACTAALLSLNNNVSQKEFLELAKSPRAGLRRLACEIAIEYPRDTAIEPLIDLLSDPRSDVRIRAMNALGICYRKKVDSKKLLEKLEQLAQDVDPAVAITAAWALTLIQPERGLVVIHPWLYSEQVEYQRLAAAAIATTGKVSEALMIKTIQEHKDPYVKANLAVGLIGLRSESDLACNTLYDALSTQTELWMIDKHYNPLFDVLTPCYIRHIDQLPNYPQAIDQTTRLRLLSLLAVMEDPRAESGIREFLETRRWGVTGFAAATLLKEGDEEALELVRGLLKDPEKNVRIQAALVLAYLGKDPSVIELLQEAYYSCDHELKLYILEAVGQVGGKNCYDFLIQALEEPFQVLRVVAASSLILCINR